MIYSYDVFRNNRQRIDVKTAKKSRGKLKFRLLILDDETGRNAAGKVLDNLVIKGNIKLIIDFLVLSNSLLQQTQCYNV